jgi:DNA repair exonuclease SbcCD ATPase subunit
MASRHGDASMIERYREAKKRKEALRKECAAAGTEWLQVARRLTEEPEELAPAEIRDLINSEELAKLVERYRRAAADFEQAAAEYKKAWWTGEPNRGGGA